MEYGQAEDPYQDMNMGIYNSQSGRGGQFGGQRGGQFGGPRGRGQQQVNQRGGMGANQRGGPGNQRGRGNFGNQGFVPQGNTGNLNQRGGGPVLQRGRGQFGNRGAGMFGRGHNQYEEEQRQDVEEFQEYVGNRGRGAPRGRGQLGLPRGGGQFGLPQEEQPQYEEPTEEYGMQGYEEGYQTEEADPQHMHQPETTEPPPVEEPECGMEDPFALPPEHRELDRERIDDRFIDRERYERFAEIVSILENMKGRPLYKNNDVTVLTLI